MGTARSSLWPQAGARRGPRCRIPCRPTYQLEEAERLVAQLLIQPGEGGCQRGRQHPERRFLR